MSRVRLIRSPGIRMAPGTVDCTTRHLPFQARVFFISIRPEDGRVNAEPRSEPMPSSSSVAASRVELQSTALRRHAGPGTFPGSNEDECRCPEEAWRAAGKKSKRKQPRNVRP